MPAIIRASKVKLPAHRAGLPGKEKVYKAGLAA
jgi:hypothetical protein